MIKTLLSSFVILTGLLLVRYLRARSIHRQAHLSHGGGQLPPRYPSFIPYLGSIAHFLIDCPGFLKAATSYAGELTSSRISIAPFLDIYLFQDRDTLNQIWKNSTMMCAGTVNVYACKYLFGMPDKMVALFAADNSGPYPKPFPGSNVLPHNRIHRLLNQGIDKALTGPGFEPTFQRFRRSFMSHMSHYHNSATPNQEWMEIGDFRKFIHDTVGLALVEAIFGPSLLHLNPDFMDDLYAFDHAFPWLAKGIPSIFMPKPYKVRRSLHESFKRWYAYADEHFDASSIASDGDGDPFWGSTWMRERQAVRSKIPEGDSSLAAIDLGVAWAAVANLVSASALSLVHVAQTRYLPDRIRAELETSFGSQAMSEVDIKSLSNNTLLSSIYAETLRLHVKSFTVLRSPLEDISLGRTRLPKGQIGLVNSYISHMDSNYWNTRDGMQPVDRFWAERFIVDPSDASSGPTRFTKEELKHEIQDNHKPFFSLKGLDGSWIPYGGGQLICPGRIMAKSIMTFACAHLVQEFDFEVMNDNIEFSSKWFGFGTEISKHPLVVRMRSRQRDGGCK